MHTPQDTLRRCNHTIHAQLDPKIRHGKGIAVLLHQTLFSDPFPVRDQCDYRHLLTRDQVCQNRISGDDAVVKAHQSLENRYELVTAV